MKKIIIGIFITTLLSSHAFAIDVNGKTQATATLISSCTVSATDASFGSLNQVGASSQKAQTQSNFSVLCTKGTPFSLQLSLGANTSGGRRYLVGSSTSNQIQYGICAEDLPSNNMNVCSKAWYGTAYPQNYTATGVTQVISAYIYSSTGYYTPDNYSDIATLTLVY